MTPNDERAQIRAEELVAEWVGPAAYSDWASDGGYDREDIEMFARWLIDTGRLKP